mgnify:CR=1 FL=1
MYMPSVWILTSVQISEPSKYFVPRVARSSSITVLLSAENRPANTRRKHCASWSTSEYRARCSITRGEDYRWHARGQASREDSGGCQLENGSTVPVEEKKKTQPSETNDRDYLEKKKKKKKKVRKIWVNAARRERTVARWERTERDTHERGREGAFRFISARRMPRRVSINSRRGANSCRWNARVLRPRREVVRLCVPFGRATGFPIGDSSLIRRWRVSNRTRTNDHLRVCYTVTFAPRLPRGCSDFPRR